MAKGNGNAGNSGGSSNGKGSSGVLLPSDVQDAIRRDSKRRRRSNKNVRCNDNGGLFASIAEDRTEKREAAEAEARNWVFESAVRCLNKTSWYPAEKQCAFNLLSVLCGLEDEDNLGSLVKSGLGTGKEQLVWRWFAGAIVRARRRPRNTPGQLAEWFEAELATARAAMMRTSA